MIFAAVKDLVSAGEPRICAHNAIKINMLDFIDYFLVHKMKYPMLWGVFTSIDLLRVGLFGSYAHTHIFVDSDIPQGKIQYGIDLGCINDINWSKKLGDFSFYIERDWSREEE